MRRRTATVAAVLAVGLACPPQVAPAATGSGTIAAPDHPWQSRIAAAAEYTRHRPGTVGFAVVGEQGRIVGGRRMHNRVSSASVIKSMLLVAYLRRSDVRHRRLSHGERATLEPMIRRSDDDAASSIFAIVGQSGLRRLADRAGMRDFATNPRWGLSQISAFDMARYFHGIDALVPPRHRDFVMWLLAHVVRKQRWGVPPAVPDGWRWHIKGGWINGVVNQVALLTRGPRRLSLAVLIEGTPDTEAEVQHRPGQAQGPKTITGVARRLLRGYE